MVSTIQAAINTTEGNNQQEEKRVNNLRADEAKHRDQLAELKKRNEESASKVALYEDPDLEDAMNERIQNATDRKEKALQAELKKKIGL